jgi:hypothetical protein
VFGAAATPVVAAPLLTGASRTAVGFLLAAIALLSLLCILAMSETRDTALGDPEPGRGPATCPRTFEDTNADR